MVALKFETINAVNEHQEIPGFKKWCKSKKICTETKKTRKFHGWTHLDNLKSPKKIVQCGYFSGSCNTKTVNGIGGYRNTCPIGGCNGDFPGPAKIQISDFNFAANKITDTTKVNSIEVSFYHRMHGIGTKTGTAYFGKDNSPNFTSSAVKVYFSKGNTRVSKIKTSGNPPYSKDKKFDKVTFTFKDLSITDILANNFCLNIEYNFNHNTNPGILYLKGLKVDINYKNSTKYIEGSASSKTLYTSSEQSCRGEITHTIEAGFKNGETKIAANKAPEKLGSKIQCISSPNNVTVTQISSDDLQKVFKIVDNSNIEGEKEIKYALSNDKKTTYTLTYQAKKRAKPSYSIAKTFKANEDFNPNKSYIIFKNGCASSISIYIDSVNSTPLNLTVANQGSTSNLLDSTAIQQFHTRMKSLSCGKHILYIKRGDESIDEIIKNKVTIEIKPMNFKFKVYTNETSSHELNFTQNKTNNNRYATVIIKRIDDEPLATIPRILIKDETQPTKNLTYLTNFAKGQEKTYQIDKYYSGNFKLVLEDVSNCKGKNASFDINIDSLHKQHYDYIFTRGQDGTAFDIDYLVVWEGDNIKEPISIDSMELIHTDDDIRICSDPAQTGLSQVGLIDLKITNQTNEALTDIPIELNVLKENDNDEKEVTTEEWISPDGIFNQFYNLFYEYNPGIKNNIDILNLTEDNDLVDEENVFLFINQIEPNSTLSVQLPFRSTSQRTVFLQYLLFEKPLVINSIANCDYLGLESEATDEIQIDVYDSMLTELEITGNTDLLKIDHRYTCPEECYTTVDTDENGVYSQDINTGGITYKITNIDSNDFDNQTCLTQIINSNELIPYAYISEGNLFNLLDNNGNRIEVNENRYLLDLNGEMIYDPITSDPISLPNKLTWVQEEKEVKTKMINYNIHCSVKFPKMTKETYVLKTDGNGSVMFYIPIPQSLNRSYTINELLESVLTFEFKGNYEYNKSVLTNNPNATPVTIDTRKDNTVIEYKDNYRRYKGGEVASISITLYSFLKVIKNYFDFNAELKDNGDSDQVTILYKICNIENNEGIFKTTFKTNDKKLVKNEVSKNIYCGLDTNLVVKSKIDKRIVENYEINVININVENIKKENHGVEIQTNLGKHPIEYLGRYDFLDIDIQAGDYSIIDQDGDIYVSWLIGDMDISEKQNAVIKIKAKEIGISDIKINAYDYLHNQNVDIEVKDSTCQKCDEENKWSFIGSPWKSFDGVMYKLFADGKYKRRVNGKWVNKK